MALPELEFKQTWTAGADTEKYIKTKEPDEVQARKDLQIQHDNTAAWALLLVNALKYATNLGESDDYSDIGTDVNNVKEALLSLKSQITQAARAQVLDYSITSAKLSGTDDVGDPCVGTSNLIDGAVTTAKLSATSGEEAVNTSAIRSAAVTHDKLSYSDAGGADAAVDANNIRVAAIKTRHITDAQITSAKLTTRTTNSSGTVVTEAAVATANIQDDAVTSAKLSSTDGSEAVATENIQDGAVTSDKLSTKTVDSGGGVLTQAAVATANIQDGAVTVGKLDATTVATTVNGKVGAVVTHLMKSGTSTAFTSDATLTDYPYSAYVSDSDVTANDKVYVEFNATQINAGIFAPITTSEAGKFYIYCDTEGHAAETVSYTIFKKGTES